jgi:aspartokinase
VTAGAVAVERTDGMALLTLALPAPYAGLAHLLDLLAELGVRPAMIAHSSAVRGPSVAVARDAVELMPVDERSDIFVDVPVSLITVRSGAMRGRPGVAGHMFEVVAGARANIIAIAQGADETQITVCIREVAAATVERALREALRL